MNTRSNYAKQDRYFYVLIASLFVFATLTLAAQRKGPASAPAAVFTQDKGKFNIQLDGHTVGHEEFEIAPSGAGWTAHGTTDIKPPDSSDTRVTGTLTLQ